MAAKQKGVPVTWAQACRDVLIHSINKGQFPFGALFFIALAIILKMPEAEVSRLAFAILDRLVEWNLWGWGLAGALASGWFFHAKYQRRIITTEMGRIADERTRLQEEKADRKLLSSQ